MLSKRAEDAGLFFPFLGDAQKVPAMKKEQSPATQSTWVQIWDSKSLGL